MSLAKTECHCPLCGRLKLTPSGKPHKCALPTGWQPAKTAPKDKLILADFGWPWPVPTMWDVASESWAAMSAQRDGDAKGVALTAWFETEYERSEDMRQWMPMPALPNNLVSNIGALPGARKTET